MGLRNSKQRKNSYDVAPVVSHDQFTYERSNGAHPATVPPVSAIVSDAEANAATAELVPKWVNEEYFNGVLRKNVDDFEKIIKLKAAPAMSAGENYATLMLRVGVDVQLKDNKQQHISYMLKVPHDTEEMKKMMGIVNFFTIENEMYADVMPKLEEMYRAVGQEICFGARVFKFETNPGSDSVLLEDLRPRGYKNSNRQDCLNMEHTKCVLRKLAKFHAASASLIAIHGPLSDIFMEGLFGDHVIQFFEGMIMSFSTPFLNNVKNYKNGDIYHDIFKNIFANLTNSLLPLMKYNSSEFNVLNHGDCWSNNILFKYDTAGDLVDALFVDFQGPRYGSPAQDLHYFLMTSTNIEIKTKKFDYFLRYYHEHLVENLKLLKYPNELPSLRYLHTLMLKYSANAVMSAIMTLPVVLLDPTETAKFDNFMSNTEDGIKFKNLLYTNKRYVKYIEEVLPWMHNRGFLEMGIIKPAEALTVNVAPTNSIEQTPLETNNNNKVTSEQAAAAIPDWVTAEYFIDIVKAHTNNFKQITHFKASPATSAGDNYSSLMLQIDIDVELQDNTNESVSYMLKMEPTTEVSRQMQRTFYTFEKEIVMYNEVLPKLEKVFKEAAADVVFAPTSFKLSKNVGTETIVMENLRPRGYKNEDRLAGLDLKHTEAVLSKLAQFHAASVCCRELKEKMPDVLLKSIHSKETRPVMLQMVASFFGNFVDSINQYEGHEEYGHKLEKYAEVAIDLLIEANQVDENDFNVLNHGDCWTNNIMFEHDAAGNIKNTYFVDFQVAKYGTVALDLYYFLMTSPSLEIKLNKFDYFIRYYHEQLVKNLSLLNYQKRVPTLKDLHIELLKHGIFGVFPTTATMTAVLLDPTEHASVDNLWSTDETGQQFKKLLYTNQRYRSHASAIFQWLDKRGLLDFQPVNAPTETTCSNVPNWVDEDHFTDVLAGHVEGFDKISNIKVAAGTKTGDNYASLMLRVDVDANLKDGTNKKVSYMLKVLPASAQANAMLKVWNFFPKELKMYHKYLPEFEQMYKDVGCNIEFAPKAYKMKKETEGELVLLEDLRARGFNNGDRLEGLDMEHTKCVLRKLAQFHAVSAKRFELKGPYEEDLNYSVFREETREMFNHTMKQSMKTHKECMKSYENIQEYQEKTENLLEKFVDYAIKENKINPDDFNVLNHGDSWVNNIMFQHDDAGNIKETLFVDFQVCKYGSPAQDLYYFLMSSTHLDIKVAQFDYFIGYYHEQLLKHLKLLKYSGKVPTLKEFHNIMLEKGFHAFSTIMGVAALCLLPPNKNANIDTFSSETPEADEFRKELFGNSQYKEHADLVLTWLNRRGLLDF